VVTATGPYSATAPLGRWLSINGQVRDGQLQLSFGYGRKRYRRATIERLAEAYGSALRQLVEHCTGGASGVTPSDVALSGLNQSELDTLQLDWRTIEDVYPLSPMQQGILFHALRDAESGVYVNQVALGFVQVAEVGTPRGMRPPPECRPQYSDTVLRGCGCEVELPLRNLNALSAE